MTRRVLTAAFGSVCVLLLADAAAVPRDETVSPQIIGSQHVHVRAQPGKLLILHCDAFTNNQDGVTLIYWLVNGVFPEDTPSGDRIVELHKSTLEDGKILQRGLMLNGVTPEDLSSTFTCVVSSAVGTAQKHVKLLAAGGCNGKKKRKNKTDCSPSLSQ